MPKTTELEARLQEVLDLHARGVLTDSEYTARRAAVLQDTGTVANDKRSGGIAVLVLALVGAVTGVTFGLLAIAVGGLGNALEEGSGDSVIGLGLSAIAASIVAVVFAGVYVSGRHRMLMACGLLGTAVWHLVSISGFGVPGFLFLLLAGILAWFGRD